MGSSHISCEFEYFYQFIMTFGDQGTQGDPYGYIKTIKFKIFTIKWRFPDVLEPFGL